MDIKTKAYVVRTILQLLPEAKIVAFGSRIHGDPKKYSDLDIAVFVREGISIRVLSRLSEIFSESDLPFRIDLVDGARVDSEFLTLIRSTGETWHPQASKGHD